MSRYFYLYDNEKEGYLPNDDGEFVVKDPKEAKIFTEQDCPAWIINCELIEREYLPEDKQNKLNGHPALFVIKRSRMMPATLDQRVKKIQENIEAAKAKLEEVDNAIDLINSLGHYPSKGKESWQGRRGSNKKYLFMMFRSDGQGGHTGPDGKKKLYVGSEDDRESIEEARRLNRNYRTWRALNSERIKLNNWIISMEYDVREFERRADSLLERSAKTPEISELNFVANKLPSLEAEAA